MSTLQTRFLVSLLLLAAVPAVLAFQSEGGVLHGPITARARPALNHEPAAQIKGGVSLVMIPVHVTTELGSAITSLTKESFQLYEDNIQQNIVTFAKDDAPLSIGVLLDCSGSMRNKMRTSSEAAATFFKTANANDEFFLIQFSERPKLAIPFTTDHVEISQQIARARAFGRTALFDAVDLALRQMKLAKNSRKALVIVSDGGDNRSRQTASQIKNAIRESDVQLYAMGIFDTDSDGARKRSFEEQNGPDLLNLLAEMSGGRHFPVERLDDLLHQLPYGPRTAQSIFIGVHLHESCARWKISHH